MASYTPDAVVANTFLLHVRVSLQRCVAAGSAQDGFAVVLQCFCFKLLCVWCVCFVTHMLGLHPTACMFEPSCNNVCNNVFSPLLID